jgi:hypothetical protein
MKMTATEETKDWINEALEVRTKEEIESNNDFYPKTCTTIREIINHELRLVREKPEYSISVAVIRSVLSVLEETERVKHVMGLELCVQILCLVNLPNKLASSLIAMMYEEENA